MRSLTALLAALLPLPATPALLVGAAVSSTTLLISQAPARAQSAEAVAQAAKTITVRIEGATQGSGVLVKRDGNTYSVLTAWHVVRGQRPGEELEIFTGDGQRHQLGQGSIKRLGEVDLAVLTFQSPRSYEVATIGDVKSVSSGSTIFVSGFPLPTSTVPSRLWRFLDGKVIANATVAIPNGYQLLYSNPTLPGMSGGSVLNAQGQLVGIHASAERADKISEKSGKAVATGTNQAVPITYFSQYAAGTAVVASTSQATSADDYLAQARALIGQRGREQEIIHLTNQALEKQQSADAYFYRAIAKHHSGNNTGAIADYNIVIGINPRHANAFYNRGNAKTDLENKRGAISDYSKAIAVDPRFADAYFNRGHARYNLGDKQGAISDYTQVIAINPRDDDAYYVRGNTKYELDNKQAAISDFTQAIRINPNNYKAYTDRGLAKGSLGDDKGAIADFNKALTINPQFASAWGGRGLSKYLLGDHSGACNDTRKSALLGSSQAIRLVAQICQ